MRRTMRRLMRDFRCSLFESSDAAVLSYFRIAFGVAMLWEAWKMHAFDEIQRYYVGKTLTFSYPLFEWVRPLPEQWLQWILACMAACALLLTVGFLYRFAATGFFLCFTYFFLLEKSLYLNHFYLIILLSVLLIVVPGNRIWSADAWLGRTLPANHWARPLFPRDISRFVPCWTHGILAFQLAIPYVYGGLAKLLTPDWLLGYPMRFWLAESSHLPVLGPFFEEYWMALFMSWAGMLFDLVIVPLTIWRRTRWLAVTLLFAFHLTNATLFHIGVFPWLMLAAIPVFFESDWVRKAWDILTVSWRNVQIASETRRAEQQAAYIDVGTEVKKRIMGLLTVYAAFQLLFPLRHLLYPGPAQWTGEGGMFAWHMKLADRRGFLEYRVIRPDSDRTETVDPRPYLASHQKPEIATHADVMLQFAHFLRDTYGQGTKVFADAHVSLNGRKMQRLIDPAVDLASVHKPLFGTADWILPLHEPLPETPVPLSKEGGDADE